jgi:hypothetical protein
MLECKSRWSVPRRCWVVLLGRARSLWHYCPLSWMPELAVNSTRYLDLVPWFSHCQSQIEQSSISFKIVWCHIHAHRPGICWVPGAFLCSASLANILLFLGYIVQSNANFHFTELIFNLGMRFPLDFVEESPGYERDLTGLRFRRVSAISRATVFALTEMWVVQA